MQRPDDLDTNYGLGPVSDALEDQYADLRSKCIDRYGTDFCNSVLPRNLVYAVTRREKSGLPWWGWMILGGLAGRLLR